MDRSQSLRAFFDGLKTHLPSFEEADFPTSVGAMTKRRYPCAEDLTPDDLADVPQRVKNAFGAYIDEVVVAHQRSVQQLAGLITPAASRDQCPSNP